MGIVEKNNGNYYLGFRAWGIGLRDSIPQSWKVKCIRTCAMRFK